MNIQSFLLSPAVKAFALACTAIFLIAVVGTGGCSSSSTPSPVASPTVAPSGSPTPTPSPTPTANYFVALEYPSVPPTDDPTYGEVQGYAQLATAPPQSPSPAPIPTISSELVTVQCNQHIQFYNVDRLLEHTASLLGTADGMNWPTYFNNTNGTVASPLLTAISYPEFSSGTLLPYPSVGWFSLVYSTGNVAGSYYFGDKFDYTPKFPSYPQMRTVITVLCP